MDDAWKSVKPWVTFAGIVLVVAVDVSPPIKTAGFHTLRWSPRVLALLALNNEKDSFGQLSLSGSRRS